MCRFKFTRTQHPVGHGGFHSACIEDISDKSNSFNYIYDCGARAFKADLSPMVKKYAKGLKSKRIDLLILSHMHEDHVNGLPQLLANELTINKIVLPYLTNEQKILMALTDHWSGNRDDMIKKYTSPTKWLNNMKGGGIENIYYLNPNIPGKDLNKDNQDSEDSEDSKDNKKFTLQWSNKPTQNSLPPGPWQIAAGSKQDKCSVIELIPFLYKPSVDLSDFTKKLLKEINCNSNDLEEIITAISVPKNRKKIRDLYTKHLKLNGDKLTDIINASSICLLSRKKSNSCILHERGTCDGTGNGFGDGTGNGSSCSSYGWLSTGDIPLL